MSILSKNILLLFLLLSGFLLYPQKSYNELRSLYDSLEENNEKALPFVNSYLEKAKEEKAKEEKQKQENAKKEPEKK